MKLKNKLIMATILSVVFLLFTPNILSNINTSIENVNTNALLKKDIKETDETINNNSNLVDRPTLIWNENFSTHYANPYLTFGNQTFLNQRYIYSINVDEWKVENSTIYDVILGDRNAYIVIDDVFSGALSIQYKVSNDGYTMYRVRWRTELGTSGSLRRRTHNTLIQNLNLTYQNSDGTSSPISILSMNPLYNGVNGNKYFDSPDGNYNNQIEATFKILNKHDINYRFEWRAVSHGYLNYGWAHHNLYLNSTFSTLFNKTVNFIAPILDRGNFFEITLIKPYVNISTIIYFRFTTLLGDVIIDDFDFIDISTFESLSIVKPVSNENLFLEVSTTLEYLPNQTQSIFVSPTHIPSVVKIDQINVVKNKAIINFNFIKNTGVGFVDYKYFKSDEQDHNIDWITYGNINNDGFYEVSLDSLEFDTNYTFVVRVDNENSDRISFETFSKIESTSEIVETITDKTRALIIYDFVLNDGNGKIEYKYYKPNEIVPTEWKYDSYKSEDGRYGIGISELQSGQEYIFDLVVSSNFNQVYSTSFKTQDIVHTQVELVNIVAQQNIAIIEYDYKRNEGNGLVFYRFGGFDEDSDLIDWKQAPTPVGDGTNYIFLDLTANLIPGKKYTFEIVSENINRESQTMDFQTLSNPSQSLVSIDRVNFEKDRTALIYYDFVKNQGNGLVEYKFFPTFDQQPYSWEIVDILSEDGQYSLNLGVIDYDISYSLIMRVDGTNYVYYDFSKSTPVDSEIYILDIEVTTNMAAIDYEMFLYQGLGFVDYRYAIHGQQLPQNWIDIGYENEGLSSLLLRNLQSDQDYVIEMRVDWKNTTLATFRTKPDLSQELESEVEILDITPFSTQAFVDYKFIKNQGVGLMEWQASIGDPNNSSWINLGIKSDGIYSDSIRNLTSNTNYKLYVRVDGKIVSITNFKTL